MAHLIDKDAILAEIRKRFDEYSSSILKHYDACKEAKAQELGKILIILDTLEVKDVDLEEKACDAYCEEEIGIKEPISKTFPRVNEFENDNSYRR